MASETYKIKGQAKWSKIFPHYMDKNEDFHGPGGAYTLDLIVDQEEKEAFTATGARTTPKVTEDGVTIKFKRKATHPSIAVFGGPPQVVDADSNDWDGTLLGHFSEVEVAYTVYDTKMGKGCRMEGVRIIELVELPPMEGDEGDGGSRKLPF